jgi:hypothetical protein
VPSVVLCKGFNEFINKVNKVPRVSNALANPTVY